ncbi:MAG TPA: PGPGW domain-containing protein [Actinomycetota bacterium]|nr:PGPGW domain-containing protein [Actinomycetota bacterium]
MGIMRSLAEQRWKHIVSQAEPFLPEGDEVILWVRARHPGHRGEGFAYLSSTRFISLLTGRNGSHKVVELENIERWGADHEAKGGPLLRIESADDEVVIKMPVATPATAMKVRDFLANFSRSVPSPPGGLRRADEEFVIDDVTVPVYRRSVADQTKRIAVTTIGAILVVAGILITPLPGPWSFPIIFAGLAVLSSEYDWAQDLRTWGKQKYTQTKNRLTRRPAE